MTNKVDSRYTIAAVERDTGLSKDVLRVWERRYGFPRPERDGHGERLYPVEQVERLRTIRRLMDAGHRPGRLLVLAPEELSQLGTATREGTLARVGPPSRGEGPGGEPVPDHALPPLLDLIREHRMTAYREALEQRLARVGLRAFVQDTVAPLAVWVGEVWAAGDLQVHEEHLFTEHTERTLRRAIDSVPGGRSPRVLLTTPPHEPHALGLLMVESVLALEGAHCMSLGTQMPAGDIARAAEAHRADAVALSFSAAYPGRQIGPFLDTLRSLLPSGTALWIGGAGAGRATALPAGVARLQGLEELARAVGQWRKAANPGAPDINGGA